MLRLFTLSLIGFIFFGCQPSDQISIDKPLNQDYNFQLELPTVFLSITAEEMKDLTARGNKAINETSSKPVDKKASYSSILQLQKGENTNLLAFVSNHDVSLHGDYLDARRARRDFMKSHYAKATDVVKSVNQQVDMITLGDLEFEKTEMLVIFQSVAGARLDPVRVLYYEAPLNDHEFFGINFSTNDEEAFMEIAAALDAAEVTK
jgi:hypothetical protein